MNRPGERPQPGCVGAPLPGVELKIAEPDSSGVGEVLARGPGVMGGYYGRPEATAEVLREGWLRTGDLGRIDGTGRLHLSGRLKDVIVGADGRNVYPEEVEALYADEQLIRELCVVGLRDPEGGAERVACVAVPNGSAESGRTRAERRARVERHVRQVSSRLPVHQRIRTLHVQEGELPRTATGKLQRRKVAALLARRPRPASRRALPQPEVARLRTLVASLLGRKAADVPDDVPLDQLGFDSLMYVELAASLEAAGHPALTVEALARMGGLRELAGAPGPAREVSSVTPHVEPQEHEFRVPPLVAALGRRGVAVAERLLYDRLLNTTVTGRHHVPRHTTFIAAANHSSHLDAGLVRAALGEAGEDLLVLAAADYFFDTPMKRTLSGLGGLMPVERGSGATGTLVHALQALERGQSLLVFPEGTRSRSGALQPFHPGVGHLALRARMGVLPVYVKTHHALPPGGRLLRSRALEAHIGPFLGHEALERGTAGLTRPDAAREVARTVQRAVEALRDGAPPAERVHRSGRVRAETGTGTS